MPLRINHDGSSAGELLERCCMCRTATPWWHSSDVALCPACAKTTKLSMLPTKKEWCAKEKALMPKTYADLSRYGD